MTETVRQQQVVAEEEGATASTCASPANPPSSCPTLVVNMPPLNSLLPVFSGKDTENPVEFMTKIEEAFQAYQIPPQNWKWLLRPQFVGDAMFWFDTVPQSTNYPELKKLFFNQFDNLEKKLAIQA
ncbi:Hypothetical predicted protein, partial [Olea europaea subsp. europaea]